MKHVHRRAERAFNLFQLMALALIALVTTIAVPAHAEWTRPEDVPWYKPNASNIANPLNAPDTTWSPLAASKVDTTMLFRIDDCDLMSIMQGGKSASDTLVVANFIIYSDSSVASTVSFKATTAKLQANFSNNSANWQDVMTYTSSLTDGQKAWVVPIWVSKGLTQDLGIDLTAQSLAIFGANLRFIVTGGASVASPMTRCALSKYVDWARRPEGER